ncbi:hypothetical protein U5A82_15510 [Sphingobium sp. CR2-8]|uniref:hypothetical protein n=1 Tax=Sphingobium sp. CR2-8 TaxID=1306534 RepID=UPI002DBBB448|nr:hypothetical protein [Sphingobium sp. CR2-8]MEC3911824.1 hypothetical protein [Sphingobium sp. CR2-8]
MTRGTSGRPLRFFAMIMMGWIMVRLLSPGSMTAPLAPSPSPLSIAQAQPSAITPQALLSASAMASLPSSSIIHEPPQRFDRHRLIAYQATRSVIAAPAKDGEDVSVDLMKFISFTAAFANRHYASDVEYMSRFRTPIASPPPLLTAQKTTDRWRAGAWLLYRPGGKTDSQGVPAGQLGGSQAGFRLDYDITPRTQSRIAAYGRLTTALERPAAPEGAVGLSFQPTRALPVSIAVERRIALGQGGRNANTVMAVGGFGPKAIAPAIEAEGYAQAGIVGFRARDAFVDGKLSLSTPVPDSPVQLGVALSGGAQPGISRLDIGPQLQVRLPLPQAGARVSVEWRERIAGDARPGSGLAVTLAADF